MFEKRRKAHKSIKMTVLRSLVFVCVIISIESASIPLNYAEEDSRQNESNSTNNQQLSVEETMYVINQAQEVIYSGLNSIKENVDKLPPGEGNNNIKPNNEDWQKLNETLEEYFKIQAENTGANLNKTELLQSITASFLLYTNGFLENFFKGVQNGKQAAKPPGFPQNLIALFTGGTQQVAANLTGEGSLTTTAKPNVISNIFGAFGQRNASTTTQAPQDSNSNSSPPPASFLQGAFEQIVSNFRPTPAAASSSTTKEEPITISTTTPRGNPLQNLGSQIGNLFKQTTTPTPPPPTSSSPSEASNFIQNVGQAIQNANPFSRTSTEASPVATTQSSGLPFIRNTEMFMCVNVGKMLNRQN